MGLNKAKGRMFKSVGWTWNPIAGCTHSCKYCWAESLTKRWGKSFEVQFREKFIKDKMPEDGSWIFVGSMGDTFCEGIEGEWIDKIFEKIIATDNQTFLLQTKNPEGLFECLYFYEDVKKLSGKIAIGTTLETNRDTPWSDAPSPIERWYWLMETRIELEKEQIEHKRFLSLEPLADFDLETMKSMIKMITPHAIEIGKENYGNHTTPPSDEKILDLLIWLDEMEYTYVLKENLDYLQPESMIVRREES